MKWTALQVAYHDDHTGLWQAEGEARVTPTFHGYPEGNASRMVIDITKEIMDVSQVLAL